jgi:hypothetical protein
MEPQERLALINRLMEEATQKKEVLENALYAQQRAGNKSASSAEGTPYHQMPYTLQAEKEWWEKAHHGLTIVYNAFQQIEYSERQREVIARGAGA